MPHLLERLDPLTIVANSPRRYCGAVGSADVVRDV